MSQSSTSVGAPTQTGKYLTFALGREEYGLAILKVREIIGFMEVTRVPRTPAYVCGVLNLRGQVIPVIDLRTRFGMEAAQRTEATCIIVAEIQSRGQRLSMGVVVDRVLEVVSIAQQNVEECPEFGGGVPTEFIQGIAKVGESVKILLDVDRVLTDNEVAEVGRAAGVGAR
jgi:purine-binding chemotaxis protein CheW